MNSSDEALEDLWGTLKDLITDNHAFCCSSYLKKEFKSAFAQAVREVMRNEALQTRGDT